MSGMTRIRTYRTCVEYKSTSQRECNKRAQTHLTGRENHNCRRQVPWLYNQHMLTGLVSIHIQRIQAAVDDISESYGQRRCCRVNQTTLFNLTLEVYTIWSCYDHFMAHWCTIIGYPHNRLWRHVMILGRTSARDTDEMCCLTCNC
jgi:hypothetical protein